MVYLSVSSSFAQTPPPDTSNMFIGNADTTTVLQGRLVSVVNPLNRRRVKIIAAANIGLWGLSFYALNKAWYAGYARSSFHFFNDIHEWNGMDKAGHGWTSYQITRASYDMWRWTGVPKKTNLLLGGISGIAYQSIIEIQDGFSAAWGFSWTDMAANVSGAVLFTAQQAAWDEQRITLKLGYWPQALSGDLQRRRNALFGDNVAARILKEYNAQTYWASANIRAFLPASKIPKWFSVSFGYGASGMFGAKQNTWTNAEGLSLDRRDIRRVRHFYLAPDVDLTRIKTRSRVLKTALYLVNCLKFPAPALEINSDGKLRVHALKF